MLQLDCRHYRGDKPCKFHCGRGGCTHYEPMGKRILIVKLDAIGDVARTTTLLRPLRSKFNPCHITWLLGTEAEDMLRGNSLIDVLLPYRPESLEPLRVQRFDLVLSLDKTARAASVAMWANAPEKLGFGLSEFGTIYSLNPEAEYALQLGHDDELKFTINTKTYQEVLFEAVKLPYNREEYVIETSEREYATQFYERSGITSANTVVGLNLGGGSAFAHKIWGAEGAVPFLKQLLAEVGCHVVLFGAQREHRTIESILSAALPRVVSSGTSNTIRQFQALIGRCNVLVTGDSLGMHMAIAEKRPAIVLFGPTCAQEIELYGRGERVVSPLACAPCYRPECRQVPNCMEAITPAIVVAAIKRWLAKTRN